MNGYVQAIKVSGRAFALPYLGDYFPVFPPQSCMLLGAGAAADRYGRKRMVQFGLASLTTSFSMVYFAASTMPPSYASNININSADSLQQEHLETTIGAVIVRQNERKHDRMTSGSSRNSPRVQWQWQYWLVIVGFTVQGATTAFGVWYQAMVSVRCPESET
jgi:MFS family permease